MEFQVAEVPPNCLLIESQIFNVISIIWLQSRKQAVKQGTPKFSTYCSFQAIWPYFRSERHEICCVVLRPFTGCSSAVRALTGKRSVPQGGDKERPCFRRAGEKNERQQYASDVALYMLAGSVWTKTSTLITRFLGYTGFCRACNQP